MKNVLVLLAMLSMVATGCAKKADLEAERAAILKADTDWNATLAAKDPEGFTSYFAADAVVYPPHLPAAVGTDGIRAWASESMALPGFSVTTNTTTTEIASSGDMAYTLGTFTFQATMPDGTPVTDNGKFATIWKKQADGTWKVVVDMYNSDMPYMPPSAPADTTAVQGQ